MKSVRQLLSEKNYMITIPSRERSFMIEKQTGVWKHIGPLTREYYPYDVGVFVREEEFNNYSLHVNSNIVVYAVDNNFSIANKRQLMLRTAIEFKKEFLFIIDDDVTFFFRDNTLSSLYTSRHEDFKEFFCFDRILYEAIMLCSKEYPIIGLPLKLGSQTLKYRYPYNIPVIRFVCYHIPTLIEEQIKVDTMDVPFMSDRYVQLKLLSKGYKSISNGWFAVDDYGTGYKGGCSVTRTVDNQSFSARILQQHFPYHVELKVKEDGYWDEKRLDCKIDWKKFLPEESEKYLESFKGIELIEREGYKCLK